MFLSPNFTFRFSLTLGAVESPVSKSALHSLVCHHPKASRSTHPVAKAEQAYAVAVNLQTQAAAWLMCGFGGPVLLQKQAVAVADRWDCCWVAM